MRKPLKTDKMRVSTHCVMAGEADYTSLNSINVPIYQNSAFGYDDMDEWIDVSLYKKRGDIYSRTTNPTVRAFEEKAAILEGAEDATACSSGMAAINNTLMCFLKTGDRAVAIKDSYGATYLHFAEILPGFGIKTKICETTDHEAIESAIEEGCKLVYLESPTNPTLKIVDIKRIAAAAKKVGAGTTNRDKGHGKATIPQLVENIDSALQTASMIETCRIATENCDIVQRATKAAICHYRIAAGIAILAMIAAWVAVFINE